MQVAKFATKLLCPFILLQVADTVCRYQIYLALNASTHQGINVQCTNMGGEHMHFDKTLHLMEHSKFCLVLPGDSASTRRLSEIFMAGMSETKAAA